MIKLLLPALLAGAALAGASAQAEQPGRYVYLATKPQLRVTTPAAESGRLTVSANALDFGNVLTKRTSRLKSVLILNESALPAAVSRIEVEGSFISSHNCPAELPVGDSCTASVAFTPTDAGPHTGVLTVRGAGGTQSVALSGTAADSVMEFSKEVLSFGSALVPNVATSRLIYLTNDGQPATYGPISVSGAGYSLLTTNSSCNMAGGTMGANTRCALNVQLLPTAEGLATGELTVNVGGTLVTAALQGLAVTPTFAFSGSNSSYTTPGNTVLVANTWGITTTGSASTTLDRVYMRPTTGGSRTYTMTLTGDPRIEFYGVSSHHVSLSQDSSSSNASGYSLTFTTPNNFITVRPKMRATVTEPGTHVLESELRVTSSDGAVDLTIPLSVEFRYDVAIAGQRIGIDRLNTATELAPGAVTDLGITSTNQIQDPSPSAMRKRFFVMSTGTQGMLKGRWSLSGDAGFSLSGVRKDATTITDTCGASIAPDGQSTTDCTSGAVSSISYPHQSVYVSFAPTTSGVKNTTLTFTPDAATGLAPSTFKIRGESRYDITASLRAGGSFRHDDATPYVAGSVVNMGTASVAQGLTVKLLSYASVGGTFGKLKGSWSLSGSPNFTLLLNEIISDTASSGNVCGAVLAGGRSTASCIGAPRQSHGYWHLRTQIQYKPTAIGTETATLTFTPDPGTGLAPMSMDVQASGI